MQNDLTEACESTHHRGELYRSAYFFAIQCVFHVECPDYWTLMYVIWYRSQKQSKLLLFS